MLSAQPFKSCRSPEWVIFWPMLTLPFGAVLFVYLLSILGLGFVHYPLLCLSVGAFALLYCGRIIYYSPVIPWRKWIFFASLCLIVTAQLGLLIALPLA